MRRQKDQIFDIEPAPTSQIEFATRTANTEGESPAFFTGYFRDECFVMSRGVRSMPNPEVSGTLCGETAIWAYRHIAQKSFYSKDKEKLMKRIFRSVNISCYQKQRESGFEEGLAATLLVVIAGQRHMWIGNVGDHAAYILHNGAVARQTSPDVDERGALTKMMGLKRYGLIPQYITCPFLTGDTAVMVSPDAAKFTNVADIIRVTGGEDTGMEGAETMAEALVTAATRAGGTGNLSVTVIRRTHLTLPTSSLLVNPV